MTAIPGMPPKAMSLPPSAPVTLRIGPYRPRFEIGSGGMAKVYLATEVGRSGLDRTVTLKVMHEHLAKDEPFRRRFLDEARVLTRITHPYVCQVLAVDQQGERPYMVMKYLVGEPLSRLVRAARRYAETASARERMRVAVELPRFGGQI